MNLHPVLSSFPFSLLVLVAIFEVLNRTAYKGALEPSIKVTLILATAFIGAAFYSGYGAAETADQTFKIADDAIGSHHSMGRLLLFSAIPSLMLRFLLPIATRGKKILEVVYLVFLVLTLGLSVATGYLGGELVFKHGAGVAAKP